MMIATPAIKSAGQTVVGILTGGAQAAAAARAASAAPASPIVRPDPIPAPPPPTLGRPGAAPGAGPAELFRGRWLKVAMVAGLVILAVLACRRK